ncbi:hypothetical protein Rhe02_65440 [Rhizocola hellebori]|uniref:Uncharacterized protein n=1 Tax=Rhizocola hellebori TaxID=1392758 RepID=A0A8J3QED1_9ACTN|nr:hypothetical protein [Rhizocola hellebori]GIH08477.1 hypothetical protein Rhe02_65440 [Rhizocola hellebori]
MTEHLTAALESIPVPPSGVTAEGLLRRAKRAGQRRRRIMIGAAAGTTALAMGITAAAFGRNAPEPVAAAPSSPPAVSAVWKVERLPLPAGIDENVNVTAIDPTGRFIGGFIDKETDQQSILWDNGVPTIISPPARANNFVLLAVNSSGVAVGSYSRWGAGGEQQAWQYRDGVLTMLPAPDGDKVLNVNGINSHGDLAGVSAPSVSSSPVRAVVWTAAEPRAAKVLETVEDRQFAHGINDARFVSGSIGDHGGDPCVWEPNGALRKLPTLGSHPHGVALQVNAQWAAGALYKSDTATPSTLPARWDLRTGELRTYPGYDGSASAADDGTVLIKSATLMTPTLIGPDGTVTELPLPADAKPGQARPVAMNRDATVVIGGRMGYPPLIWRKS